jgi:hypothetical protein
VVTGAGLTVIVYVPVVPLQLLAVGVTKYVNVEGLVPELLMIAAGI